jgi:hypothetical protein
MTTYTKSGALVVRPRAIWRKNTVLSLAAFGLTAAAVYFISQKYFDKSSGEIYSKAVAVVEQKIVASGENFPIASDLETSLNLKNIKIRVMSPAFIRQALLDCGIGTSPADENNAGKLPIISLEQIRQGLKIQIIPQSASVGHQISLELTLNNSPDASRIVRTLADRLVREYQTFWTAEMRDAYLAASEQADQARQSNQDAVEKLLKFKENISKQGQTPPTKPTTQSQTASLEKKQPDYNPAWIEINGKIESMRRHEVKMLETKTPLHPDIQYIRSCMADLEQRLEATPRFIAESSMDNKVQEPTTNPPVNTSSAIEKNNQESEKHEGADSGIKSDKTAEILAQLQDAVTLAEREYREKLQREQQIFDAGRKEPVFSVNINPLAVAKHEQKRNHGLMELMLFSGFAMAIGVGVFSSGVTSEPVLGTIADLEPYLLAPIIGVVPGKEQVFDPAARRHRQVMLKYTAILCGGLLVLGCFGCLYWFFSQIVV